MEEDVEIIYLALTNQIVNCIELLDQPDISAESREMVSYILQRSEILSELYREKLEGKELTMKRPQW